MWTTRRSTTWHERLALAAMAAIVAALLCPVFSQARENSRQAQGLRALKQVGMALTQYAQDYDDRLPGAARADVEARVVLAGGPEGARARKTGTPLLRSVRDYTPASTLADATASRVQVQATEYPANACLVDDASFQTGNGGCQDLQTGLVWGAAGMDRTGAWHTWNGASYYCSNLVEGSYSDWRVPTKAELQAVAANGAQGHLNVGYLDHYGRWSSTRKGNKGWMVMLSDGSAGLYLLGSGFDVVCVR